LLKCYTILGYSTETVLLIFPFLQTNIIVQMRPSRGCSALSVCPQHDLKTNDPKVIELGIEIIWFWS